MSGESKVLYKSHHPNGSWHGDYMFFCPGCKHGHLFDTRWTFNGNMDKPTFSPSLLVRWPEWEGDKKVEKVCHSFVTDGRIQFLTDCTHELAGKTVDLPLY